MATCPALWEEANVASCSGFVFVPSAGRKGFSLSGSSLHHCVSSNRKSKICINS